VDLDILRRGFKLIEHIYDESINAKNLELHRIKDVGNGLAENHWICKQWLVSELSEFTYNQNIHVAAGWLGLTAYLLRKEFPNIKITSSDMDPGCKILGEFLFDGHDIDFKSLDTVLDIDDIKRYGDVYVNTSTEHIEQQFIDYILQSLNKGTIVALQSNNYFEVADHINCYVDLDGFVGAVDQNMNEVLYSGEIEMKGYNRFMVIGIV
jgi:hypothetical protein